MSLSRSPPASPDKTQHGGPPDLVRTPETRKFLPVATPVYNTEATSAEFATEHQYARTRYRRLARDIKKCVVGPIPVEDFLGFLPSPDSAYEDDGAYQLAKIQEKTIEKEDDIYGPFHKAVEKILSNSGMVLVNTSSVTQTQDRGSLKPDFTMYPITLSPDFYSNSKNNSTAKPYAHFGLAELVVEIKMTDPFCDPNCSPSGAKHEFVLGHFPKNNKRFDASSGDLGQNVAYAIEIQRRQHRSFCFTVMVIKKKARLLRWDRAGVIVSEAFSYATGENSLLAKFLWGYAKAPPQERGYDMSVRAASDEQDRLFEALIRQRLERDRHEGALSPETKIDTLLSKHYQAGYVSVIGVGDDTYLTSVPVASPGGLASRGTRGYWAISEKTKSIVFLKDTWRVVVDKIEPEGDVLLRLNQHDVPNIPTFVEHEHVTNGSTLTDQFANKELAAKNNHERSKTKHITSRAHYRIVVKEAGYRLSDIRGSHELFSATLDVHDAITFADYKAKAYHRDLSMGNIILMPEYLSVCQTDSSSRVQQNWDSPEKHNLTSVEEPISNQVASNASSGALPQPHQGRGSYRVRKGVLIDWELCSFYELHKGPCRKQRTGTWQFMAIAELQRWEHIVHNVYHEIESLMWIVLYCAMKLLPHDCSDPAVLGNNIRFLFDYFDSASGTGGDGKVGEFSGAGKTAKMTFEPKAFSTWYKSMIGFFSESIYTLSDKSSQYTWKSGATETSRGHWEVALKALVGFTGNRTEHEITEDRPTTTLTGTTTSGHPGSLSSKAESKHRSRRTSAGSVSRTGNSSSSKRGRSDQSVSKEPRQLTVIE